MARTVTNHTCLIYHERSARPPLMRPLGNLDECLVEPYNEHYLCPTVCLLGAASFSNGPVWMRNVSQSCHFNPVSTPLDACIPVYVGFPSNVPLGVCSEEGLDFVGNIFSDCIHIKPALVPMVSTHTQCYNNTDYMCTDSLMVRIQLPDLVDGTLPLMDIFWYCGGDQVRQIIPVDWLGCCSPVCLEVKTRVRQLTNNT